MTDPARKYLTLVQLDTPNPLDRAIADFLAAKAGKSHKTILFYQTPLYQFRTYSASAWPPTPESINDFLNDCKRRGLKESSIEAYYKALRTWLAWLVKRGKLAANPIELAERPPAPKLLPRVPRHQELRVLFDYLEAVADKGRGNWLDVRGLALWSLALDTGLRVGELAALNIQDIAIKGQRTAFVSGLKTHQDRTVVFSRDTAKDIKRWLKVRSTLSLPIGLTALFVSHVRSKWGRLTTWGMRDDLKGYCRKAGISHLNPHRFRNAYAVETLRNGGNVLDVQKQLGHRRLSTTERYLLVDDEGRAKRHDVSSPRGRL